MANFAKKKLNNFCNEERTGKVAVYIITKGIQKRRCKIFTDNADECGFDVVKNFSPNVSHVVTAVKSIEDVTSYLKVDEEYLTGNGVEVVKDVWLSKCIEKKTIVPVTDDYRIYFTKVKRKVPTKTDDHTDTKMMSLWTFDRATPLKHNNKRLTDALEVLEQQAEFDITGDYDHTKKEYIRALAFRRCSSTLKALPFTVTSVAQVKHLPYVGEHTYKVIEDIIEDGFSAEVDRIENDEWYQKMKLFTGVFGVGASTAKKWIDMGLSSIEEARQNQKVLEYSVDPTRLSIGLAYYEDLNLPVKRCEAEAFTEFIRIEAQKILPGTTVDLTGGFRRGKDTGHDIDLLISHPVEGCEEGLLLKLVERLKELNISIYGRYEKRHYKSTVLTTKSIKGEYLKSTLDYFEKWMGVIKVNRELHNRVDGSSHVFNPKVFSESNNTSPKPTNDCENTINSNLAALNERTTELGGSQDAPCESCWLARRVDLVITPASQYPYALVGWTGSRHFNREMRRFADTNNKKLTSHGLYDFTLNQSLDAITEEDVFRRLGITYQKPQDRNA